MRVTRERFQDELYNSNRLTAALKSRNLSLLQQLRRVPLDEPSLECKNVGRTFPDIVVIEPSRCIFIPGLGDAEVARFHTFPRKETIVDTKVSEDTLSQTEQEEVANGQIEQDEVANGQTEQEAVA